MIASKAELAEFLKIKLAAIPMVYILVKLSPTCIPNTLRLMKNRITNAKNSKMWSSVFSATPTSRILRERNRRSLYTLSKVALISGREISPLSSLSKTLKAAWASSVVGKAG